MERTWNVGKRRLPGQTAMLAASIAAVIGTSLVIEVTGGLPSQMAHLYYLPVVVSAHLGAGPRQPLCHRLLVDEERLLLALMPDEPEVIGLLALTLLIDSRRAARTDSGGDLLTLEEQDRSLWDVGRIEEGRTLVERSLRMRRPGPYQLQAAIAALHAESPGPTDTDWTQIARRAPAPGGSK